MDVASSKMVGVPFDTSGGVMMMNGLSMKMKGMEKMKTDF